MARYGLAFCIGGRWWRYRFDPDWLAAELAVPRTDLLRKRRFALDRAGFLQSRAELPEGHPKRLEIVAADDVALFVHPVTGEIRGDQVSPAERRIKSARDKVHGPRRGDE